MYKTKIIATVGPVSNSKRIIRNLIESGVSAFRLNFSHGAHEEHKKSILLIRDIAEKMGKAISIIADLQGPKIRTGKLENGVVIFKRGQIVKLTIDETIGNEKVVSVDYPKFVDVVRKGMIVLLSEGLIRLRVEEKGQKSVTCKVLQGGILGERKGVNVIGIRLESALTEKDKRDIRFVLKYGVDYFALSFVSEAADVLYLREFLKRHKCETPIIAKIERPQAVKNLRGILGASAGVMVARGDLGVEGKLEEVPIWQKKIIRAANREGKLVVTATQMLESMMGLPRPTRAEVTDVASAILDGTCAVMLSGETAVGKYPVKTVKMMRRISASVAKSNLVRYYDDRFSKKRSSPTFSIAHAAVNAAREAAVKGIIVFTLSGKTARYISLRRPAVPIFALSPSKKVRDMMALWWGIIPVPTELEENISVAIKRGCDFILKRGILKKADQVVLVYGETNIKGGTDQMRIVTL